MIKCRICDQAIRKRTERKHLDAASIHQHHYYHEELAFVVSRSADDKC